MNKEMIDAYLQIGMYLVPGYIAYRLVLVVLDLTVCSVLEMWRA
jgi:hypothetical protein